MDGFCIDDNFVCSKNYWKSLELWLMSCHVMDGWVTSSKLIIIIKLKRNKINLVTQQLTNLRSG